ncbi:MAG TPA: MgtC/SapB family protein [Terriglobales bacterium]|nr:MgtC/SapB family protein [Terriglobales bacterium]
MQGLTFHGALMRLESAEVLSSTIVRLILAAALGGIIGLEREFSHKPAGLRTNMFICFGSAMFTVLSVELAGQFVGDHTRIAAQIIPGIGFIGAGSILHSRGSVQGLTTAATLFVVSSIGMAAGGGFYLQAVFATILILIALQTLGWFETRFSLKPQVMRYEAVGAHADKVMAEINRVLEEEHHVTESVQIASSELGFRVYFTIDATRKEHDDVLEKLRESPTFKRVAILRERTGE